MKRSLSARHSFFGEHVRSGACGPQGRVLLSRLVLGEVHRSCLRSEFVRGVAAGDTVLPKWCTVSVPWSNDQVDAGFSIVVSDPRFKNRHCGADLTTVSSAPPLPPKSTKSLVLHVRLLTRTSRRHDPPWAQCPLGAASAVRGAAPWASRLRMLGRWRHQYTWGSCSRATRDHSRPPRRAGSFA